MKVILLKDVAKIGRRLEVANVPDGYALNMLIPKGLAEAATPENMKKLQARTDKMGVDAAAGAEAMTAALETLKAEALAIMAEANEKEHLFEALKPEAVIEAAKERGVVLDVTQITIKNPIKSLGEHTITLQAGEVTGDINLKVMAK